MRNAAQLLLGCRTGRNAMFGMVMLAAALVAAGLVARVAFLLLILVSLLYILFALYSIRDPLALAAAFMATLILLPPFYFPQFGDTPVYPSLFLLPISIAVVTVRLPDFHLVFDSIAGGLCFFLTGTGLSLPFAFWLSGSEVGFQSLFRWLMLSHLSAGSWWSAYRREPSGTMDGSHSRVRLGSDRRLRDR